MVESIWQALVRGQNVAGRIAAKFKNLRRGLKKWSQHISKLAKLIKNCNEVLEVLDKLEDQRQLCIQERNFKKILKKHILTLLKYQNEYWRKRYTMRWVKLGDEDTKFFHAAATERYRINTIT